jgi:uncharacterized protein
MQVLEARPAVMSSAQDFLIKVYAWMAAGLALTGVVAYLTVSTGFILDVLPYLQPLALGLLAFVFLLQLGINRISSTAAALGFVVYAALLGVTFSPIFLVYTRSSIAQVFFITAGTFGGMSLYGMVTRTDLSTVGSTCIMGFWGIFIASLVNAFFVKSDQWSWIISFIGVFVFTGLAAYDNQRLVRMAQQVDQSSEAGRKATIIGALILYLDFINLFLSLLRLLGRRR